MRLTNDIRHYLMCKVKEGVPRANVEELTAKVQEAMLKGMSKKVRALYRENPKILCSRGFWLGRCLVNVTVGDADKEKVLAPFLAADAEISGALTRLELDLNAMTTAEEVVKAYPEFTPLLTNDAVAKLKRHGLKLQE